ncbi:autotransporter assembly complex protein TamB [Salmonella enterica subsp. enterica serovar Montevideo]
MSLWKKISLGVLIFIVVLLASVAFLVGTTTGLHLVFSAANRWVPGLEIGQVTGGWRDLSLKNIRYEQPGVAVNADEIHLAVGLDCLWRSSLCVNDLALKDINVAIDSKKMPPSEPAQEEEESGPLNLSTPWPITLSRVALNNINIKIDDTTVSVLDFTSGLAWQEKNLTLKPTRLQGLLIALPKVADVAQEEVVEPKIEKPQPDEKPLGETLKDLFAKPVMPEMTDVHLPLNLNIESFRGEQLRITGDTDLTVRTMLLKVSSIDGNMKLDTLDIDANQGTVKASGTAQLANNWPVDITLNSTLNIDPLKGEKIKLKVGGALREQLEVGVNLSGPMDVPELKLTGNVKQNSVNVNGTLKGNSYMQWTIPGLHLALGPNSADIKGELGVKELNLDAAIDAPGLDNALPGLGGMAKGIVKVRGTVEAPQLLADITARGLRWQELSVAQARIEGDIKSTDQIAGHLNVRVERISQPDVNINLVTLDAKGSEKQHQLQLRVQGEPVSGQLSLTGSFDREAARWKGTLSDTRFQTPVGPWSLTRAIALDYRNKEQKISIGPHCWLNPNAELCVPQTIDAGAAGRAVVNLNRFDLAMLKPFMPDTTQASGIFSGKADVSWDTTQEGLPQGKVTLSGRNVKVTQTVNDAPLPVAFETLNLSADLHNNRAELGWLIRLTNNGQFDGQVQVTDPQGRRNLGGNVNMRNVNLAMINPVFSRGEKAAGMLNARLRLGGDVQSPQLFGQLQLSALDIDGNFMPFEMQPSQLTMNFSGTRSTLAGIVRTQQGQINLNGNADWSQIDNWRARVTAKGSRVRITVPPMVRLDVSPDVVFDATPSLFTLDGRVDVPWARIVVHDLPESAVGVSSDVVMLNNDLQPETPQTASIPINSNLTVHVGNNVRIDAFGLKARLTGDLKVAQDKQGLGLNGQINIPDGRFRAYGQDLLVRKGELLFSGPPDQPLLNIEAIRNPDATEDDVIAGVRVTGTADEPKAEIFSDPAMPQAEALSYLLRGQGLDSNQSDSAAMTSMLIGLGVAQSGQVVGKIGETFGVSNLALDTQGVGDSSQVVVSGYVLPGLQVKYGVGIFDSLATLTLRYRLMPKLYLEAVSGVDQALDLLYQFEF